MVSVGSKRRIVTSQTPLLIAQHAIKDCEQHTLTTYQKGAKVKLNLSAAFSIAKLKLLKWKN
jgi:hypothetical protein